MYCLASKKNKTSYLSEKKGRGPDSLEIKGKQWNLSTLRHFLSSARDVLTVTEISAIWWLFTCLLLVKDMTLFSQLLLDSCPYYTEPILISRQWTHPHRALGNFSASAKVRGRCCTLRCLQGRCLWRFAFAYSREIVCRWTCCSFKDMQNSCLPKSWKTLKVQSVKCKSMNFYESFLHKRTHYFVGKLPSLRALISNHTFSADVI